MSRTRLARLRSRLERLRSVQQQLAPRRHPRRNKGLPRRTGHLFALLLSPRFSVWIQKVLHSRLHQCCTDKPLLPDLLLESVMS